MSKIIKKAKKAPKKKVNVAKIRAFVSFNNTIITATDILGNVLCWSSSGREKFKGAQKTTPYAAKVASERVRDKLIESFDTKTVSIIVNGPGLGKESVIRAFSSSASSSNEDKSSTDKIQRNLIITSIKDITPVAHGGCKPKKKRKV